MYCLTFRLLLLSLFVYTCASVKANDPVVEIADGKIRGTSRTNFHNENFWAFLSIPYANPPLGNLRFKAPQRVDAWEGIKNSTEERDACTQYRNGIVGSEDCLHLHVFTRKLPEEEQVLKPVMVFIPGGGFVEGSNSITMYGPDFLLTEDIVLVTVNYRLGVFGFLSLDDTSLDVPGNAGLKNQLLALEWVKKNIEKFNGNPNNVTLFGESAGSASVEYLLLSQAAKNLFHGAITQSGSTLNNWARPIFDVQQFSEYVRTSNTAEKDILKSLTNLSASELIVDQYNYLKKYGQSIAPVIEKPNPTAIITEHPIDIIKSGHYNTVPVISGFNSEEGLLLEFYQRRDKTITIKNDWPITMFLPYDTDFNDPEQVEAMSNILTEFYNREENINDTFMLPTDGLFASGIVASVVNQAKVSNNPVYLYRFSLDAGLNLLKILGGMQNYSGACHGDDIGYLFTGALPLPTGELEIEAVRRHVKMWTNFAKYGNPTPQGNDLNVEWKPVQADSINYLDIGNELVPSVNLLPDRVECWREVFKLNNMTAKFL